MGQKPINESYKTILMTHLSSAYFMMNRLLILCLSLSIIVTFSTMAQTSYDDLLQQGQKELGLKHFSKAIDFFNKAHVLEMDSITPVEGLVQSYCDSSWFEKMNGRDHRALSHHASKVVLYYVQDSVRNYQICRMIGYAAKFTEQYDLARKYFKKAIALNPKDGQSYFHLWTLIDEPGTQKTGHEYIKKAMELAPTYADIYIHLGDHYQSLEKYNQAIDYYEHYIALTDNFLGHYNLGNIYYQINQSTKAISQFEEAIKRNKNYCWSWYMKGASQIVQQHYGTGVRNIRKAVNINSGVYNYYEQLMQFYPELEKHPIARPE